MENSTKMLMGDTVAQWYVAVGQKWVGPLSAAEIYEKVVNHQLTLAHYVWKKGQADWKRICDIKAFQSLVPHQPQKVTQKQLLEETRRTSVSSRSRGGDSKIWYLYHQESQLGPFSVPEIQRFLQGGKITGRTHVWRDGMRNWDRLERVAEFRSEKATRQMKAPRAPEPPESHEPEDQRDHPRRPLVAKILMSDQESVIVGVCRDISIGGLQVLTDTVPGPVGTQVKMNISPSGSESGDPIQPFVAEGVIVRILEDGRGFSFRFNKLSDRARQTIESYIESLDG